MIGVFGSKTLAAMQRKNAALEEQVASLSACLALTTDQLAEVSDRLTAAIGRLEAQAAAMADADQRSDAIAGLVADQTAAIMRLDEQEEQRLESHRQVRSDIARLERQAAIDVAEFRQTSLVLAERLLLQTRGAGAQAAGTE